MLQQLQAEHFKSWRTLNLDLAAVTGLFGTNSSGKSSIIQFLLMLKQTKNATDRGLVLDFGGDDQLVNLGTFQDVIYQHNAEKSLQWSLRWELPKILRVSDPLEKSPGALFEGNVLATSSEVFFDKEIKSRFLTYTFAGHTFELRSQEKNTPMFRLNVNSNLASEFRFVRQKGRAWSLPAPIKTHLFPDQAKTYHQNADFLGFFESEYEAFMNRIYYLGPLREYPQRQYQWSGTQPLDVGYRGERTIDAILSATSRGERRNLAPNKRYKTFQEMIAYWLQQLGLIHSFSVQEIMKGSNLYRAIVQQCEGGAEVFLTDVGFGVSQVLPALVLLYYVPEGSTILMEQPEIHLHPAVQSGLADVILQVAQHRNVQVIVESHSEHLLRRFQRRIAEDEYPASKMKLYFCSANREGSSLSNLKVNPFGEIENWPNNFFGDEMAEIAATQTAAIKRKISANRNGQ
ncbi:MAG: DUF3696 domain-containing protein [Cyanobacteria bacterium P01_G01_bin.54]